jgi:hypothetical protein
MQLEGFAGAGMTASRAAAAQAVWASGAEQHAANCRLVRDACCRSLSNH